MIEFDIEEVMSNCQDYDSLDLKLVDEPSIIINKKYIHKLSFHNGLDQSLNFKPTQSLSLEISDRHANKSEGFIQYLQNHSLDKLSSEVEFVR